MVLMGINRIVVTDGKISAKVMYDFRAQDKMQASASSFDYENLGTRTASEADVESDYHGREATAAATSRVKGSMSARARSITLRGSTRRPSEPVVKISSATAETTDAALQTKAQLAGSVEVNFKSDYFPLEKMADSFQIGHDPERVQARDPPRRPARAERQPAAARSGARGRATGARRLREAMTTNGKTRGGWADPDTLQVVRPEVRRLLEASPGFARLSDPEKKDIAATMVKVAAYMANPDGLTALELAGAANAATAAPGSPLARAQDDAVEATKQRLAGKQGFAGKDFEAGAVKQGVQQFGELVKKVDFPKFVGGLIKNVFQAIVESSIDQMRAYGELLANVAKTVDQFAQDNITPNNARDWLAGRFPDALQVDTSGGASSFAEGEAPAPQPRLVVTAEDADAAAKRISDEMQITPPLDRSQRRRAGAAHGAGRAAANRPRAPAAPGFNGRARDQPDRDHRRLDPRESHFRSARLRHGQARGATASMHDSEQQHFGTKAQASYGGWYSPVDASMSTEYSSDHVATVQSSVDETSESKAEVKAKLSGEVRVNFKSDYFPMEKLASPEMMAAIQGNAKPPEKPVAAV